jgi:hypothetical protein
MVFQGLIIIEVKHWLKENKEYFSSGRFNHHITLLVRIVTDGSEKVVVVDLLLDRQLNFRPGRVV